MFTIGMEPFWTQMPKIKEEIISYANIIKTKLEGVAKVTYGGIADNLSNCKKIEETFTKSNIDLIIIHVATYGLSKNVINSIKRFNVPIITLHLQPIESFKDNFSFEYVIPKCTFAAAGELGTVLRRFKLKFYNIFGTLNEEKVWEEVNNLLEIIYIKKKLNNSNIALLGETYPGMLDLYIDRSLFIKKLGINIEDFEVAIIQKIIKEVTSNEIKEKYAIIKEKFIFDFDINKVTDDFNWNIKVAIAMEKLVDYYKIDGMAYHYFGFPGSIEEKIGSSMILGGSILNNKGIPVGCEGDIPNIIAMLILKLFGNGATQAEHYYADYKEKFQYIGHSGPADIKLASKKPILKWLDFFHGKQGSGVSCEFSIKEGPITMMSLSQLSEGELRMIVAEGRALGGKVSTGEVTTKVKFDKEIRQFMKEWTEEGPSHHSSVCLGHISDKLSNLANILDINFSKI